MHAIGTDNGGRNQFLSHIVAKKKKMSTGGDVKLAANLAVLQRMDPSISEVLCNAAHVTLYLFSEETSTWQKLNVEGSLFVVRRAREPHHQYIVMNRRSADNYVEDISSPKFAIQDADPYLMYRNQTDQIVGIWFYDAAERVVVAKLLREITDAYKQLATNRHSRNRNRSRRRRARSKSILQH
jgi:hypothetical protein